MIINTGMRTDIPAFYAKWFLNRLRAGFVLVRNPYRPDWITRYELNPDVVDCIAFCTKNPHPMLMHLEALRQYHQYWFVTITPYGKEIEPHVPPKETVMQDFITLSKSVGIDCVGWRYDPIFLDGTYTLTRHLHDFAQMCQTLSGYTKVCVISFIDLYEKVQRNFPQARTVTPQERITIGKAFAEIGRRYNITIKACGEGSELAPYGVDCNGCMTQQTFEHAIGSRLQIPKQKSQRTECACILGSDIGAYDTCGHFCRYCYANYNHSNVERNMRLHDPESPFLVGSLQDGEVIHSANQTSWIDRQLTLF
ncbi:MAG TPA: DUF1848 domain-containing protein [Ruminococcus sp.]|nr:DUF1848 domain-containing protein [Ruminococcus sp.]